MRGESAGKRGEMKSMRVWGSGEGKRGKMKGNECNEREEQERK